MSVHVSDGFPPLLLTEGGPGDAVLRRLRLAPLGQRARRASIVLAMVTWIPLLVLSLIGGVALHGASIPFFYDIAAHVRFLVALPVLLLAEIPIGQRLREVSANFVDSGLVRVEDRPRFVAIVEGTMRLRDSRVAELVVLAAAYATSFVSLSRGSLQGGSTWATPVPHQGLTAAGVWYAFVSIPVFQFVMYRWLYRMFVWARFLRSVSRLDLELTPTHPDGAGGLSFVGKGLVPFGGLLFATSAVVASAIASRVLFGGMSLQSFKFAYAALFVVAILVFVGPLLVFVPNLLELKHRGHLEYGTLASRYTRLFHRKWVKGPEPADEPLLGSADIQSLADLGNSFELVKKTRVLPLALADFVALAIPGVIPAIPLAATVMPVSEIVKGLLHLLA